MLINILYSVTGNRCQALPISGPELVPSTSDVLPWSIPNSDVVSETKCSWVLGVEVAVGGSLPRTQDLLSWCCPKALPTNVGDCHSVLTALALPSFPMALRYSQGPAELSLIFLYCSGALLGKQFSSAGLLFLLLKGFQS